MEQLPWLDILKILGPFIAGGGMMKYMNLRLKRRELNNKISKEEYETFDEILNGFMQRNSQLATDIADIRERLAQSENRYRRLEEIISSPECTCRAKGLIRPLLA